MFRNLSTSTKLLVLCGLFVISLAVTTYSLVTEKQIAIEFARKELIGSRYIAAVRSIYGEILAQQGKQSLPATGRAISDELARVLSSGGTGAADALHTTELEQVLLLALSDLPSGDGDDPVPDVLAQAQSLILRAGDGSNLALDPDLDSYYLQAIVVTKLPAWLGRLAEMRALFNGSAAGNISAEEHKVRFQVQEGILLSILDDTRSNLNAALRGNLDGSLKTAVDGSLETAIAASRTYLDTLRAGMIDNRPAGPGSDLVDQSFANAVGHATTTWMIAQDELDRLLQLRIDGLLARLRGGLGLTGALAALSLAVAYMTYRHIVKPLKRLETVARTVRETKNYRLRMNYDSRDEIGQLAAAFNDMLSELSAAREREMTEQAELARSTRLTTIGAMTASIAHEVNQPLAAVVANSNAALRWLANREPDLDEARAALKRIVRDGHRASEVIGSVRAMFKKERSERTWLNVNDLAREVLLLAHGSLETHQVAVRSELCEEVPGVLADRVQLQQVLLNLIVNGAEAMASVTDRERLLRVSSEVQDADCVVITVTDSGTGIDLKDVDRIFEPFYTTKANGMGMGLPICRSIIESHGGRLWATPMHPNGTAFHISMTGSKVGNG